MVLNRAKHHIFRSQNLLLLGQLRIFFFFYLGFTPCQVSIKTSHSDHRSKESIPQGENSKFLLCEERKTIGIDILKTPWLCSPILFLKTIILLPRTPTLSTESSEKLGVYKFCIHYMTTEKSMSWYHCHLCHCWIWRQQSLKLNLNKN